MSNAQSKAKPKLRIHAKITRANGRVEHVELVDSGLRYKTRKFRAWLKETMKWMLSLLHRGRR